MTCTRVLAAKHGWVAVTTSTRATLSVADVPIGCSLYCFTFSDRYQHLRPPLDRLGQIATAQAPLQAEGKQQGTRNNSIHAHQ